MDAVSTATAASGSNAATQSESTKKAAQDVQDRFLTLLVTQMKNQDPLNPLDNAQLTTQLAQISTVTGVDQMHQTMKAVLDQIKQLESLQASSMNGRNVMVTSDKLELREGAAVGGVELTQPADSVTVTIRNAAGGVVRELELGAMQTGTSKFDWNGATSGGATAADGAYSFSVKATVGGKEISATTMARGRVGGVLQGETVQLDLGVLGKRPIGDVREIL